MIAISKPMIGAEEKEAVMQVLDSGIIAQGPKVQELESLFAAKVGVKHAVATSSGTTALHTMLLAHDIGPGDEVITSPFTFIASANSILYTGARPVFVDIDPVTYNINPALIEAAITPRTKAIIPVHLFGLSCEMDAIMTIAKNHGLLVLEDAAQSIGATYCGQQTGSFGTGSFSLYATKNITSAEGGMITTNDDQIAERCRVIRQHGMRRRYYHDEIGFNFRTTDIHAAIGVEQLKKLDTFTQRRRENARILNEGLKGVQTPKAPDHCEHVYHQYTIRVPRVVRDEFVDYLNKNGVGSGVFYPIPIHKQAPYVRLNYDQSLPESEAAAAEVLSLPVHPALTSADLETIITTVNGFISH